MHKNDETLICSLIVKNFVTFPFFIKKFRIATLQDQVALEIQNYVAIFSYQKLDISASFIWTDSYCHHGFANHWIIN